MRVRLAFSIATLFMLFLAALTVRGVTQPVRTSQWNTNVATSGVRSVIGEVGWGNPEKPWEAANEWVSVMGVYAARVRETGWPLEKIIRKYSAAVKNPSIHKRAWLAGIQAGCYEPKGWPKNLKWSVHRPICEQAFLVLNRWANGDVKTLTPLANHYGGVMDSWRADNVLRWQRVKAPGYYKNIFYNSRVIKKQVARLKLGVYFYFTFFINVAYLAFIIFKIRHAV